jgi:TolB-like protein
LNRINREGLAGEYGGMLADYVRTGILNRPVLEKIGRALGVAYVFQPSLASFGQSVSSRFSFFGLRLLQTRVTTLRLTLQLWDARSGEIVWESSGEATLAGEDIREFRIPFDEIARRLWSHMLDDLFMGLPLE